MKLHSTWIGLVLALTGTACVSFSTPPPFEPAALRLRAVTETRDGITASAVLLRDQEVSPIFGLALDSKGIQPVWLELENRTEKPVYFLVTGLDPEYFPPLEVAHAFHSTLDSDGAERMDAHVSALALDNRAPILPGTSVSGFVYTNTSSGTKVVELDFVGPQWSSNLTLFVLKAYDGQYCDPLSGCFIRGQGGAGTDETVTFSAYPGVTYYVAVDGRQQNVSTYDLSMTCDATGYEDCGNGTDDDGDTLVDCNDPECFDVPPDCTP